MDETKYTRIINAQGTDAGAAQGSFIAGEVVGERYRIESLLGRGGMGVVYSVEQIFLHRRYAMKMLDILNVPEFAWRRFQKEAEAINRLDHPNAVHIHDFGLIDGQQPYYVMDLVDGESLEARVKRSGPLPLAEALQVFIKISFALAHAHEKGVIHRDIKPSNIMLQGSDFSISDSVKLVDFGISKLADEGSDTQNLTRTGEIFGSPLYMSPEQCLGTAVDYRTDIYSVGCALFDALTGTPPHIGNSSLATIMKHREEKAPSLREASLGRDFPDAIEDVVARLLEKDPDRRYQNFNLLAADLISIEKGLPLAEAAAQPQSKESKKKTEQQKAFAAGLMFPMLITIIVILTGAVLSLVAFLTFGHVNERAHDRQGETSTPSPFIEPDPKAQHIDSHIQQFYDSGVLHRMTGPERYYQTEPFSTICTEPSGRKVRIFQFPNTSLGKIMFQESNYVDQGKTILKEHGFNAQGDVLIPTLLPLRFAPSHECCEHPTFLGRFRKDEIVTLRLENTETATDDILAYTADWKGITGLNIENDGISDKGLSYVGHWPKLTFLRATQSDVTGAGLSRLKRVKDLKVLYAGFLSNMKMAIAALRGSQSIIELLIPHTNLTDSDMKALGTLKNLSKLDISGNEAISDKGLAYLANLPKLTELICWGCNLSPACIATLKTLPSLRTFQVNHEKWDIEAQKNFKTALPKVDLRFFDSHDVPGKYRD